MSDPNYYEMLEISPDATPEEVREAYRLLTMVWHPDRFPKDSKLWAHANEKMQQINEAYNALKNLPHDSSRPIPQAAPTRPSSATTHTSTYSVDEQQRRTQNEEQQRIAARRRADEQQQRLQEQKRREETQRALEARERLSAESEQRRLEADRLRVLMRQGQRVEEIQQQRAARGVCVLCGQSLSPIEKLTRRNHHRDCSVFIDDSTANNSEANNSDIRVQETAHDS